MEHDVNVGANVKDSCVGTASQQRPGNLLEPLKVRG